MQKKKRRTVDYRVEGRQRWSVFNVGEHRVVVVEGKKKTGGVKSS